MDRHKALLILAEDKIKKLKKEERESILLNWWGIDDDDMIFRKLPRKLRREMIDEETPISDVMDKKYNVLIIEALKYKYCGVKNSYLSEKLTQLINKKEEVKGTEETLFECPCCGYLTLEERGQYYICPVCYWEDDGSNENEKYSGVNHMTLREGKKNFRKYNAVTKSLAEKNEPDMKQRYFRNN